MDQPNFGKLTSLHFHAWSKGLKTGMYYLRSRAAADAIKFTVDTSLLKENLKVNDAIDDDTKMAQKWYVHWQTVMNAWLVGAEVDLLFMAFGKSNNHGNHGNK